MNTLKSEDFGSRLAQTNLASKDYIADFVKKTDFDNKLKSFNRRITSNKRKDIEFKNKLDDLEKKIKNNINKRINSRD